MNKLDWSIATQLVEDAQNVLIVTHVNPDGDAIGSMLGLGNALRAMGKQVDMGVDDGVPKYLSYLPGAGDVYAKITTGKWDVMISTDASDEERSGTVGAYGRNHSKKVINLDHHVTNTLFGDAHLVMGDAVSATEVVFHWLHNMNTPPATEAVALPLLTGLVTDTIAFRTSNVKPETLSVAQQLMKVGISLNEVVSRTLESKPYSAIRLWGQALQSVSLDDQIISVDVTKENLNHADVDEASDSGLVSLLNQVDEARVAVIFFELPDNKVKISLRSKVGYDVGSVALELGGGGHKQASGATIGGTLATARERVFTLLKQAIADGSPTLA